MNWIDIIFCFITLLLLLRFLNYRKKIVNNSSITLVTFKSNTSLGRIMLLCFLIIVLGAAWATLKFSEKLPF
jgi:hypothetical protein